jgi:hypothetical protein
MDIGARPHVCGASLTFLMFDFTLAGGSQEGPEIGGCILYRNTEMDSFLSE